MIAIVHYGLGNIQAFVNIFNRLNIPIIVARVHDELVGAEKILLPGVGTFDWAMKRLNESGMRDRLDELVLTNNCMILGVCVGMQMMANRSDEGVLDGLGWINGAVRKFDSNMEDSQVQLPHMGWNDVSPLRKNSLFKCLESDARFYFLHSYYIEPADENSVLSITDYHKPFASSVRNGNVFGVQFHPEKSHGWGIQLLKNFAEMKSSVE